MRNILSLLLTLYSITTFGQKIEYRHDSLFVDNFYVDETTKKSTLDSILKSKGIIKHSKDKYLDNPSTNKKVKRTTYFYYDLGLFFRTYDDDTTQLSVGVKLYRATDKTQERESELTETFSGQLFIAGNLINDKRKIEQLQNLDNCSVTITRATMGYYSTIIGGDLINEQTVIKLSFDIKTQELIAVYIHHNFKEK